jgi:hypothetical protein
VDNSQPEAGGHAACILERDIDVEHVSHAVNLELAPRTGTKRRGRTIWTLVSLSMLATVGGACTLVHEGPDPVGLVFSCSIGPAPGRTFSVRATIRNNTRRHLSILLGSISFQDDHDPSMLFLELRSAAGEVVKFHGGSRRRSGGGSGINTPWRLEMQAESESSIDVPGDQFLSVQAGRRLGVAPHGEIRLGLNLYVRGREPGVVWSPAVPVPESCRNEQ